MSSEKRERGFFDTLILVFVVGVAWKALFGQNGCAPGGGIVGWVSEWLERGNKEQQFEDACKHVDALRLDGWIGTTEADRIVERIRRGTAK